MIIFFLKIDCWRNKTSLLYNHANKYTITTVVVVTYYLPKISTLRFRTIHSHLGKKGLPSPIQIKLRE